MNSASIVLNAIFYGTSKDLDDAYDYVGVLHPIKRNRFITSSKVAKFRELYEMNERRIKLVEKNKEDTKMLKKHSDYLLQQLEIAKKNRKHSKKERKNEFK